MTRHGYDSVRVGIFAPKAYRDHLNHRQLLIRNRYCGGAFDTPRDFGPWGIRQTQWLVHMVQSL